MKMPKKPKKSKLPKKPKASASLAVWERYEVRCKEVVHKNADKEKEYTKKVSAIKSAHKKKEAIVKKYS